jgi:hypothetical protein
MRIGEIIETNTLGFVARSDELHEHPPLGSLVKVRGPEGEDYAYAVVSFGQTASPEPGRRAVARGGDGIHDEAVYQAHPQLPHILQTEFHAALVGCVESGQIYQHLPAQPPRLHYDVLACTSDEVRSFSERLPYFRMLLSAPGELSGEQLLAAHIRATYRQREDDAAWLERAARGAAALLKGDYERLMTLLHGIDPG